jgi:ribosomal protein S18 acetylase RimI-like enzyme
LKIRTANKEEAGEVAFLIHRAVGEIANILFGSDIDGHLHALLVKLFQKRDNRVSHNFIDVVEMDDTVAGMAISYPGETIEKINKPIYDFLQQRYSRKPHILKTNVIPMLKAKEAETGEYYLDALAVHPKYAGNGVGSALIKHVHQKGRKLGYKKTSLLVEKGNIRAYKLYRRLGYKNVGVVHMKHLSFDKMLKKL